MSTIPGQSPDVTALLKAWGQGQEAALNELIPLVHAELRRIAGNCMRGERAGRTLQATALVNEAYMRLVDVQRVRWQDRAHFLSMAARLMRRVLVDAARFDAARREPTEPAGRTPPDPRLPRPAAAP